MPSSLSRQKQRSLRVQHDSLRQQAYFLTPDFIITIPIVAANFSGANSGIWAFVAPFPCIFLGLEEIHATAGTNNFRAKKVLSAATSAPGAAADANNIDISATVDLTAAINVVRSAAPVVTAAANRLAQGDKVALASAAGTATLAGGMVFLRFAAV